MGTFSQTSIKCNDIETIVGELKRYLPIGREIWLGTNKWWFYNVPHDENSFNGENLTLIVSQNLAKDWVEVEFDFQFGLYFFDEILKQISKNLNTVIVLAYYQSTSDEGRLAKFINGQLELSYYEKYFYEVIVENDQYSVKSNYIADNFGVADSTIEELRNSKLGDETLLIEYDFIYKFLNSEGWRSDSAQEIIVDEKYLHLEQLK
ncbi:hypothetical protein [Flavobacterium branchiicola]|uniref:Immunity protein 22 of polymorphic toxin system n=1 Tax=Flavobacterium branchiicola TaxID=1114875 RepID=A0ABV9PAG1_9FLAO|nr:hypothetical protein [Flavobacterium branchiicola]MBS7253082.1 hypothetical protein [Flavobacterium branchiicola]